MFGFEKGYASADICTKVSDLEKNWIGSREEQMRLSASASLWQKQGTRYCRIGEEAGESLGRGEAVEAVGYR